MNNYSAFERECIVCSFLDVAPPVVLPRLSPPTTTFVLVRRSRVNGRWVYTP